MLIKQNIEFEVWVMGPGSPDRTACTPITGKFHDKTEISRENVRVDYYLLLNYCRRQCSLLPGGPERQKGKGGGSFFKGHFQDCTLSHYYTNIAEILSNNQTLHRSQSTLNKQ